MNKNSFNPHDTGIKNGNYFGFPNNPDSCDVLLISVPWDVTVSYRHGTSLGPESIIEASVQLDFFDYEIKNAWETSIASLPISNEIKKQNSELRKLAEEIIQKLELGEPLDEKLINNQKHINAQCAKLNRSIKDICSAHLSDNKHIGIVGGDHSVPLGLIEALCEKHDSFGILHIDAHADLRDSYEGFEFSHASIMFNVLKHKNISKLVQVAIRDVSAPEVLLSETDKRISVFSDYHLKEAEYNGKTWNQQCLEIVEQLPEKVYISFDIDGLTPDLCPNTGTPVPGGLDFNKAMHLLHVLHRSGKTIVGFDLCEVAPGKDNEWDANVGARVLYKLCQISINNEQLRITNTVS